MAALPFHRFFQEKTGKADAAFPVIAGQFFFLRLGVSESVSAIAARAA